MQTEDVEEAQGHSSTAASPVKRQSCGEGLRCTNTDPGTAEKGQLDHMDDEVAQVKQHSVKQKKINNISLARKS